MARFGILDGGNLKALQQRFLAKEKLVGRELANAINKAARETVNLSSDEWRAFATTSPDYIKNKLDIVSGAAPGRLRARVHARSRATRANRFRHQVQPGRGGVRLNVRRGATGAVIKRAFVIPRARSDGQPLILERLQKYRKGEGRGFGGKRFKAVYGPSVNQHFHDSRERVTPRAMSTAKQQFLKAIGAL